MVGRYVHRFGSRQGFEGAIVGIWAYQDENDTYRMALQVNMRWKQALHFERPSCKRGAAIAQVLLRDASDSTRSRG